MGFGVRWRNQCLLNPAFTAEVFAGFAGNDLIDGRGGFDRADYNVDPNTTSGITVNLAAGTVTAIDPLDLSIGTDTLRSVEGVRGTNFADIYDATGFSSTSTNADSWASCGNGGDDTITGNGSTRISFQTATAGVNVDFGTSIGIATGDSSVGTDHFTGVNAVQASMFDDTLLGGSTNDVFTGLAGNDSINGRGGFDTSSYNNIFFTTSGVNVNMAAGTATGDASIGTDTLHDIEAIQGTMLADRYNATGYGLAGAANVSTSNGNFNQFEGLGGNDQIIGNGNTQILFGNATAGVTVDFVTGSAIGDASVGYDTFTGINSVAGSNFNDTILGSSTNEIIGGGAGNDIINGSGGDDTVTGGPGADTFVYATGGGADQITDFNRTQGDRIDLTGVSGIFSLSDVQSHAATAGSNTVITFTPGNSITLQNVAVGSLVASDFIFAVAGTTPTGDANNNSQTGTVNADTLSGSAGNDQLQGLAGNDVLDGGLGTVVRSIRMPPAAS